MIFLSLPLKWIKHWSNSGLYLLTENYPKPLLDVGGKAILDWFIDDLDGYVDEFIIVTNHKFADFLKNGLTGIIRI